MWSAIDPQLVEAGLSAEFGPKLVSGAQRHRVEQRFKRCHICFLNELGFSPRGTCM
jgi:hypothetical protein